MARIDTNFSIVSGEVLEGIEAKEGDAYTNLTFYIEYLGQPNFTTKQPAKPVVIPCQHNVKNAYKNFALKKLATGNIIICEGSLTSFTWKDKAYLNFRVAKIKVLQNEDDNSSSQGSNPSS